MVHAPRRTLTLMILLIIVIGIIIYFRFLNPPEFATPPIPPSPTATSPTSIPTTPPLVSSPSATPQPTPLPTNTKTGWLMYQNPFHQFSFEFPPSWKLQDFGRATSPMATVVNELNNKPIGFTISIPSWGSDAELSEATPVGSFTFQGWQGGRYQITDSDTTLTIITATKSASLGKTYRINWVYPSRDGAIDTYLKPILKTLSFTPLNSSPSATPLLTSTPQNIP